MHFRFPGDEHTWYLIHALVLPPGMGGSELNPSRQSGSLMTLRLLNVITGSVELVMKEAASKERREKSSNEVLRELKWREFNELVSSMTVIMKP